MSTEHTVPSNLDAALAYLEKFPEAKLFPAEWDQGHKPRVTWSTKSSGDPATIKIWARKYPNAYFCIALKQSGKSVLDVDNKHGKRGADELTALELEHGDLPQTLIVGTPSGDGRHYHFDGAAGKTRADLYAVGLDSPVMVPVPGATVPGKGTYTIITNGRLATRPEWLKALEKPTTEERTAASDVDLDLPHNVSDAIEYLTGPAPEAIEGQGGDSVAYTVACRVRDLGVSEALCEELMAEHYADKCHPFDADWLAKKVYAAYRYAQNQIGADTPEAEFEPVPQEEPAESPDDVYHFLKRDQIMALPDLDWYIKGIFPARGLAVISGASKAGKSFLALDAMCAVVEGREWFGHRTKQTECRYIVLEGEGGLKQRVLAWEKKYGRPLPTGVEPFFPTAEEPFNLLKDAKKMARSVPKGAIIVIDTLNRAAPAAEENTSKDMGLIIAAAKLMESLTEGLVILVAHEGKDSSRGIRGHSSLFAALDANLTCRKEADGTYVWSIEKAKDGRDGDTYGYELQVFDVGVDKDGDKITSCAIEPRPDKIRKKLTKVEAEAYKAWISAATDNCAHESEWKQAMKDADPEATASTIKKRFARMKKRLVEKGYLIENDGYYRPAGGDVAEDFEVVEDDE